jgi:hypothetical protein
MMNAFPSITEAQNMNQGRFRILEHKYLGSVSTKGTQ